VCGRFVQVSSPELLVERFGVAEVAAPRQSPSYNVAPRDTVYAVRERMVDDAPRRVLSALRWGLVPPWAEDARSGDRTRRGASSTIRSRTAYTVSRGATL
jgi:putative SOS response-associated peptidase YedK